MRRCIGMASGGASVKYFWLQRYDLPNGLGHTTFSSTHLITLIVVIASIVLAQKCFMKASDRARNTVLKAIPLIMVCLEIFKDLHLYNMGRWSMDYLPFQLCGIGAIVFVMAEYLPTGKARAVFGEIAYCLILPGAVAALIFPDWLKYYPVWNFFYIYSFLWHALLVLYPVMLRSAGMIAPSIKHIWYEIVFLMCVVPPVMLFDKKTGYNYMFVNYPPKGTPLEWMASFMGNPGYLIGYTALIMFGVYVMYIPYIRKARKAKQS